MTAKTIVRFSRKAPAPGKVLLGGTEIPLSGRGLRDVRRRRIAMIFQDPKAHIDPLYRTGDHLVEGLRAQRGPRKSPRRARRWVARQRGNRRSRTRIPRVSGRSLGGMLQRVMIAGALTGDPELVDRRRADDGARRHHQLEIVGFWPGYVVSTAVRASSSPTISTLAAALCDRVRHVRGTDR